MSNTLDNNQHSAAPLPDPDEPDSSGPSIEITVDPQVDCPVSAGQVCRAAQAAAVARGFTAGEIGIRITDDASIRELNARHLNHDYETDVISFQYERRGKRIIGELVLSAETARRQAARLGWNEANELLLYVVHGVLHITGMDDGTPHDRAAMRQLERSVMLSLGVEQIVDFGADVALDPQAKRSSEASA